MLSLEKQAINHKAIEPVQGMGNTWQVTLINSWIGWGVVSNILHFTYPRPLLTMATQLYQKLEESALGGVEV